jgi:TonB family protein
VDPVSRVLVERARHRRHLVPFVLLALGAHAGVAAAAFVAGRLGSEKPPQLPSVAVRLVEAPQPQRRRGAQRSRPAATPAPQPTREPVATPAPQPTAAPERPPVVPVEEPAVPASEDAMPAPDGAAVRPTPAPTSAAARGDGLARGGISLGGGQRGAAGDPGVPSDFQFTYYLQRMLALIESRWYKPPVPPGVSARARFTIDTSGRLSNIAIEEPSGHPSYDRAVLRALYAANPLPPLPPAYRKPTLTVHLTFSE